ncbi:MAG TPA: pyridoxamine 5'-phosphate oxidase family protein [Blastocatellia bacterium]|nr:pyridoxamine 5'-phosphate oxidase family protein [Blastocatellia bacterium]
MSETFTPTGRTTVKRLPARGHYDRKTVNAILDEGLICHVGVVADGHPRVIPTGYVRLGETLYIHGSPASRMLAAAKHDTDVCVTVTLLDGLVLARSAFHHSMNYRSVVMFGKATAVDDLGEKMKVLQAFVEHVVPGRWRETRQPTESELKGTTILALPLAEASAKIRTGPPIDDEADYELDMWAGEIPLRVVPGGTVNDPRLRPDIEVPDYASDYSRPGWGARS